ncbi:HlyD family secretion protein [Rhizobium leguminosarum]|uniref:HlyD family secretion protein n=1 Tax=Rhizobium leguminosarum TaxID=384 RepID=UPI003F9BA770
MSLPKSLKLAVIGLAAVSAVGAFVIVNNPESEAMRQSTDDAYVQADFTNLASQISGIVTKLHVRENDIVEVGDLIATLDDRELKVAVGSSVAQLRSAEATVEGLRASLIHQDLVIRQAEADLTSADASLLLAERERDRIFRLMHTGTGTQKSLDEADAQLAVSRAAKVRSIATVEASRQQVSVLEANLHQAQAATLQQQAALEAAELKLSYSRITAPVRGMVGRSAMRVGAYVTPSTTLMSIVPLDDVYIFANYRETQLAEIRPGQHVIVEVDALPGTTLGGVVESLGPATGATYSSVASQNATGNFTKIAQRLPLRIKLNPGQDAIKHLRVGMSVRPVIEIGSGSDSNS